MTSYAKKERARYWPVSPELMVQYDDGSHTEKDRYGDLIWKKNGKLHRDGDKPAVISANGSLAWYQNNQLHRDNDKPAYIGRYGSLGWYQNDQMHRLCGPARIYPRGTLEWCISGENITQEVIGWINGEEWQSTPEQIFEFQLRFT